MGITLHLNDKSTARAKDPLNFLGLPFWAESREALFECIQASVQAKRLIELHSLNAEISMQVRDEPAYRELMSKNPTNMIDGEGVRRMVGLKYGRPFERISGSDFIGELAALAAHEGWGMFLLGASEEVSFKAAAKLKQANHTLTISRFSPPFETNLDGTPAARISEAVSSEILAQIASAKPVVLVSCLGAPKQELWIREHQSELMSYGVRVGMGAGGSLDFLAGKTRRAPNVISNIGLEWAWRLALEPHTRFGRMARRLPRFVAHGLVDVLSHRLRRAD